jgi:ketosteroid isomerase-like protein
MKELAGRRAGLILLLSLCFGGATGPRLAAQTSSASAAQTKPTDSLLVTITALDKQLFDAYNHCDIATLGNMVADDLEFYHDKTGLSRGKATFLDAIQKNICGKVNRHLVKESLEVYPLEGYGAVEIGTHRFTHPSESGDKELGEAKFVHLWQKTDAGWKVTRVISYDHESLAK